MNLTLSIDIFYLQMYTDSPAEASLTMMQCAACVDIIYRRFRRPLHHAVQLLVIVRTLSVVFAIPDFTFRLFFQVAVFAVAIVTAINL
jgi:hypothetical protein